MAAIQYLESVLTSVENKPAPDKENAPPLPVGIGSPEKLGQLDLEKLINSAKPGTPSPKKAWNRNVAVLGNAAVASSPSAASTQTPGATEAPMSVSPCSSKGDALETSEKAELHAALQTLAEQYAAAKKAHPTGPALCTALETVCRTASAVLHPGEELAWEAVEEPEARLAAIEARLREMAQPHLPVVDGETGSIGSIAHVHGGIGACVGLCRFHVKGKCFDGALCRFCHLSRDEHLREGVLTTGRNAGRENPSPEKENDPARRRGRKGMKNSPMRTTPPQRPHAPLAAPLLLPTPMPMMPMYPPVPMPMHPQPLGNRDSAKPPTKEQAALCELLSSLDVQPEQRAAPAMPNPYAMPAMPYMPHPYAMPANPYYDPSMAYGWGFPMQQQQQCPTVAPVQSLQAMGRRKKMSKQ